MFVFNYGDMLCMLFVLVGVMFVFGNCDFGVVDVVVWVELD